VRETEVIDQSERERLDQGLRLLRAFFRIEDRKQRLAIIDHTEQKAYASPQKRAQLSVVDLASQFGPSKVLP
jgi:hypothetical protein